MINFYTSSVSISKYKNNSNVIEICICKQSIELSKCFNRIYQFNYKIFVKSYNYIILYYIILNFLNWLLRYKYFIIYLLLFIINIYMLLAISKN